MIAYAIDGTRKNTRWHVLKLVGQTELREWMYQPSLCGRQSPADGWETVYPSTYTPRTVFTCQRCLTAATKCES